MRIAWTIVRFRFSLEPMAGPVFKESLHLPLSITHNVDLHWRMKGFHFHDVFEIYLCLSEGVQYFVEDRVYQVRYGDLFVFNHKDLHQSVISEGVPYDRWVLTFLPGYVEGLSTDQTDLLACFTRRPAGFSWCVHPDPEALAVLLRLLESLKALVAEASPGADVRRRLVLAEILLQVNALYSQGQEVGAEAPNRDLSRIQAVLRYIQDHLGEDLGREALAQRFYISGSHLAALFVKVTGSSLAEYVIGRRIRRAQELLLTALSVSEVGEAVGYSNHAHFSRMFRSRVGITPRDYRKT